MGNWMKIIGVMALASEKACFFFLYISQLIFNIFLFVYLKIKMTKNVHNM